MSTGKSWHASEKVAGHQVAALIIPGIGSTAVLFAPRVIVQLAERDAWSVPLLTVLYGLAIITILVALHNRFPGKTPVQIAGELFGPPGRMIVGGLYAWFFLHLLAVSARQMGEFFTYSLLPRTPISVMIISMLALAVWVVRAGPETFTRLAPAWSCIVLVAAGAIILLTFQDLDFGRVIPVLSTAPRNLLQAATVTSSFFGQLILLAWYLPLLGGGKGEARWIYGGMVVLAAMMASLLVSAVALFGPAMPSNFTAPIFRVVREAQFGEFLTRLDVIFLAVWQGSFFFRLAFVLFPAASSLAETFNLKEYRSLVFPVAVFGVGLSLLLFTNVREVSEFISGPAVPYAALFQLALPLTLLLAAVALRKSDGKDA